MQRSATFPILLITLGVLWFLHSTELLPNTRSLLALGLACAGLALLLLDGLNKSTLVATPMLGFAALAVYGLAVASLGWLWGLVALARAARTSA